MASQQNIFIRIDDRFIHGQVTTAWTKKFGVTAIWVVNDKMAGNPTLKQLQIMLAPPGVSVAVLKVEEAAEKVKGIKNTEKVLMLFENPVDVLSFLEKSGIKVNSILLGQMGLRAGRVYIEKTFAIGPEDHKALLRLLDMGVKLYYQQLPDFPPKPVDMEQKIRSLKF
ncbi:PTS system mannose/fructose/N-acetylgalactosamine-transporter subunit IIB [Infirmifilum sp. NZ]|uniref:PTS system mannose/fructose/N-acetylgalactosamine-transporter subunit IIB n=1 Tax=Infirmifilum sp. NZ TaxID=2926850 RepID=UPI00279E8550|nr:PTS sugar transporter subunit IIB [Infirmifilum sp. NZ]UNQ73203.1 PTS sugar transporter subunit IIB [Infirmifilum sp. NZ]